MPQMCPQIQRIILEEINAFAKFDQFRTRKCRIHPVLGLDPYVGAGQIPNTNTGKIYFNLGEISEDVLKDGREQYENGLGSDQILVNPQPIWGDVPASQSLIYAFDTNTANRTNQDIGLDGLNNAKEAAIYTNVPHNPILQQMIILII